MFLLMKGLFLGVIIGCFLGCTTDDDSSNVNEIPIITIELIGQEDGEVSFRLSLIPSPANDLAVLIETQALGPYGDEYEIGYTWLMVPRFSNTRGFKFDLDPSVPWEVRILSLAGKNLDTYPIEGTEVPVGYEFKQYRLGGISSVRTAQVSTQLIVDWPRSGGGPLDSLPANAILTFIFDRAPEDITVSHGNFITDANRVIVDGFFPLGDIEIELRWNQGRQHYTWYKSITDPDFEPPKVVDIEAFHKDGNRIPIPLGAPLGGKDGNAIPIAIPLPIVILDDPDFLDGWKWRLPVDTGEIRIAFSENIWFHEEVTGTPDIQTENGTKLGWRDEKLTRFGWWDGKFNARGRSFRLLLSDGQPLKPETAYLIAGIVTDFANDTEIKIPFTTLDR
ncbi:hypothetical protein C6503_05455 [Candidatus Poribacteria bacterium]|nr:MAG: hypothetical protein C6503_05455 [Candidatus Poribacteria bacterium]